MLTIFGWNFEIEGRCKGVHSVDLGESFPTSIYLQTSASIQPRTSLSKFGGKFNSLFIRLLSNNQDGTVTTGRIHNLPRTPVDWICPRTRQFPCSNFAQSTVFHTSNWASTERSLAFFSETRVYNLFWKAPICFEPLYIVLSHWTFVAYPSFFGTNFITQFVTQL